MLRNAAFQKAAAATIVAVASFAISGGTAAGANSDGIPDRAAAARPLVLGSPDYAGEYGRGWGKVKPKRIDNGGVPSGLVVKIRWRRWGDRVSRGRGLTSIYKPQGGYYRNRGAIQLRASHRGTCPGTDRRAYTRLRARVVVRPGGKFGRWFWWSGTKDICSWDF
jgi:hypothetical protein